MYNTTKSITILITLLFTSALAGCLQANQLVVRWSTYPAYKIHRLRTYKLTCKATPIGNYICFWSFENQF